MKSIMDDIEEAIRRDSKTLDSDSAPTISRVVAGLSVLYSQATQGKELAKRMRDTEGLLFYAQRQETIAEAIRVINKL